MADIQVEARRLAILLLLQQDQDYSINDQLMQTLLSQVGHGVALAVVKADFSWLEQVGLLAVNDLGGCAVAVLRSEGLDVARGLSTVPGIARPRPAK